MALCCICSAESVASVPSGRIVNGEICNRTLERKVRFTPKRRRRRSWYILSIVNILKHSGYILKTFCESTESEWSFWWTMRIHSRSRHRAKIRKGLWAFVVRQRSKWTVWKRPFSSDPFKATPRDSSRFLEIPSRNRRVRRNVRPSVHMPGGRTNKWKSPRNSFVPKAQFPLNSVFNFEINYKKRTIFSAKKWRVRFWSARWPHIFAPLLNWVLIGGILARFLIAEITNFSNFSKFSKFSKFFLRLFLRIRRIRLLCSSNTTFSKSIRCPRWYCSSRPGGPASLFAWVDQWKLSEIICN